MKKSLRHKPPHHGVYARIGRSRKHGVGMIAVIDIPKGTNIFTGDKSKIIWKKRSALRLDLLPPGIRNLYEDFCIIDDNGQRYGCPTSFNGLTPSWYLNHNKRDPNVACDRKYNFFAIRDIKAGHELTVDYRTYNDFQNSPTGAGPHR